MKDKVNDIQLEMGLPDLSLQTHQQPSRKEYASALVRSDRYGMYRKRLVDYMGGVYECIKCDSDWSFSLEDVFGAEQWKSFSVHMRRVMGAIMASMVRAGLLPYKFSSDWKGNEPRRYQVVLD